MRRRPPRSTLFPYTTLFRSLVAVAVQPGQLRFGQRRSPDVAVGEGCRDPVLVTLAGTVELAAGPVDGGQQRDRKSTRLNSSHGYISYAVLCLKKKSRYPRQR